MPRGRGLTDWQRFREKFVVIPGGCWEWTAALNNGYGIFTLFTKRSQRELIRAHRYSYEIFEGIIPKGLHIDHLCRNRKCVNPAHLEPVTIKENLLRGEGPTAIHAKTTHCPQGHPYNETNTYIERGKTPARHCKICSVAQLRQFRKRHADRLKVYYAERRKKKRDKRQSSIPIASVRL